MTLPPHSISTLLLNLPPAGHLCHMRFWWLPRGHDTLLLAPMPIHPRAVALLFGPTWIDRPLFSTDPRCRHPPYMQRRSREPINCVSWRQTLLMSRRFAMRLRATSFRCRLCSYHASSCRLQQTSTTKLPHTSRRNRFILSPCLPTCPPIVQSQPSASFPPCPHTFCPSSVLTPAPMHRIQHRVCRRHVQCQLRVGSQDYRRGSCSRIRVEPKQKTNSMEEF